ncbi:SURF1 family protein [Spongiibacter sp.]|uniref:SURF1 family protein n=1 Tax=Spongiibacter sp. TaxID=2024860 RepID=UPI0035627A6E
MAEPRTTLSWSLDWKSLLAIAIALPLLLRLGFWQLQRADEKQQLLDAATARRQQPAVDIQSLGEYPNYLPVYVEGVFDSQRYWLLDNRIRQGQFGYEIIALLNLADGGKLLVERGWIAADASRRQLPELTWPEGIVRLQGELYRSTEQPFSLGEQLPEAWPRRQQWLQPERLETEIDGLLPTVLRLHEQSPAALRTDRLLINVSPQKHRGYALQWFAMAAVLAGIFVVRNSNILALFKGRSDRGEKL